MALLPSSGRPGSAATAGFPKGLASLAKKTAKPKRVVTLRKEEEPQTEEDKNQDLLEFFSESKNSVSSANLSFKQDVSISESLKKLRRIEQIICEYSQR